MQFEVQTPAAAQEAGVRESDGSTRERVLQLVVEEGPISAAALGQRLNLTAAAVRRHLDAMTDQGIVEIKNVTTRRRGAGRPSRRYVISSLGQQELGDDYLTLVRTALAIMEKHAGEAGHAEDENVEPSRPAHTLGQDAAPGQSVSADQSALAGRSAAAGHPTQHGPSGGDSPAARVLAQEYFAGFEARHAEELKSISDLDERTLRLAERFNDAGFAGFTRLVGRDNPLLAMQSTQLCQGHCPIREIAAAHPVFCEEETVMISRLLDVDVRRLSTQAAGAHVCTTHVPVGREKLAAERRARVESDGTKASTAGRGGRKRIVISTRQQERLS